LLTVEPAEDNRIQKVLQNQCQFVVYERNWVCISLLQSPAKALRSGPAWNESEEDDQLNKKLKSNIVTVV